MKVFVGADHQGFELKRKVVDYLKQAGYVVVDDGNTSLEPEDDFPVFASKVVSDVLTSDDKDPRGVLLCGGGQGMAMAANRYKGIRASVIWNEEEARLSRNDNDSNIIALPTHILKDSDRWQDIMEVWLKTPFAAATRYVRRNKQLDELG